jgi:threonine synthase
MRFVSTRGGTPRSASPTPWPQGLAPDGGLFVPEELPGPRA